MKISPWLWRLQPIKPNVVLAHLSRRTNVAPSMSMSLFAGTKNSCTPPPLITGKCVIVKSLDLAIASTPQRSQLDGWFEPR